MSTPAGTGLGAWEGPRRCGPASPRPPHLTAPPALQSGVLSSLPFVAASSCTVLGGQLADFLLSRKLLRLVTVRKLFSALGKARAHAHSRAGALAAVPRGLTARPRPGLLLPSLCAVALPFATPSYTTTLTLLILIPGTSNLCDSGFIINTLDVAPR